MSRLIFSILIISTLNVNASSFLINPVDSIPKVTKAEYKKLSKSQNTTAIVLVSVGGAALIVGFTGIAEYIVLNETLVHPIDGETLPIPTGYYIAAILGAVLALCSIPVFKSAKENRQLSKNATLGLNFEKLNSIPSASIAKTYFPSLRFTVRF